MKILFIYPNAGSQIGFNYGVSHIASVLKQAGHAVEFRQLCEELAPLPSKDEFTASLKKSNPDIIGFSVVTNQWPYAAELAKWAGEAGFKPLVCGGIHATIAPEKILESGFFDYVFTGECDEAFLEFVEKFSRGEKLDDIRNMGFISDGKPRINPVRPLPELEKLPFKDYESPGFQFQKVIDAKKGWVGLMASRGCPFNCTYCFNHLMVKKYRGDLKCNFKELKYIRHFSVGQVIDEIKYILANYRNITMFIFDDDLFTFNKNYVIEFCREYKKVSSLPFVVNAHVGFFDEETAVCLQKANCRIVKFGVESGSDKIRRKIMNRHTSNEDIIEAVGIVNKLGMHSSVFIMIGLPYETEDDLMQTVALIGRSRPGRFRWTFFFPYPGTEAHRISIEGGFVNEEKMKQLVNFTDDSCLDFGEKQNLLLKKAGKIMPWFVNAYSDLKVADFYKKKTDELLALNEDEWKHTVPSLPAEEGKISKMFQEQKLSHYAIKYNPFTGVISDYFMNEL